MTGDRGEEIGRFLSATRWRGAVPLPLAGDASARRLARIAGVAVVVYIAGMHVSARYAAGAIERDDHGPVEPLQTDARRIRRILGRRRHPLAIGFELDAGWLRHRLPLGVAKEHG